MNDYAGRAQGYATGWERQRARWAQIAAIRARDGDACALCGCPLDPPFRTPGLRVTVDHVVPRSRGGTDDLSNLQLAHEVCNRTRGNRAVT